LIVPSSIDFSISMRRLIDALMVLKFVSVPPSQRWLTYGMPQRCASVSMASRAARLVPTNRILPLLAARRPAKLQASFSSGSVCSRLMMWILLRAPKMYGSILGAQ